MRIQSIELTAAQVSAYLAGIPVDKAPTLEVPVAIRYLAYAIAFGSSATAACMLPLHYPFKAQFEG